MAGVFHGVAREMARGVEVAEDARLKTSRGWIVFLSRAVAVSFVQQVERLVEAIGPAEAGVDRRMVVEVLAVVDRGVLDFVDRGVDFVDGVILIAFGAVVARAFQIRASQAKVRERVHVKRMFGRRRRHGLRASDSDSDDKHGDQDEQRVCAKFHERVRSLRKGLGEIRWG